MLDARTLGRIETLRRSLATADRDRDGGFSTVFEAFLDIAEDPAFFRASKKAESPLVQGALERAASQVAGGGANALQDVRMLGVAEAGLLHGGFFVAGSVGSFFFFEKEEQGLLAIHRGGALMLYGRITMTRVPEGTVVVPGPKGVQ
jgi:hypothetical protein